ncbi:MAG: UDP-3-O-(3-hydroxymyristoyl)glucosamine N-acyltransferase, partial [Arenibacterium sp.]
MTTYSIAEIAKALGAESAGDTALRISGASEPADARSDELAMAMSPSYAEKMGQGQAVAALLWPGAEWQSFGLKAAIFAPRPRRAMAGVTAMLDAGQHFASGIHPSAVIDASATIADDASIGPFCVIGPGVEIGPAAKIGPQCFIGADVRLGRNAFLREMVSIGARAMIGDDFIAQPGVRIGGGGVLFVDPGNSGGGHAGKRGGDEGEGEGESRRRGPSPRAENSGKRDGSG